MANKPSQPALAVSLIIVEIKLAVDGKRNFSFQLMNPTFLVHRFPALQAHYCCYRCCIYADTLF
jgi:hypothetical protein